MNLRSRRLLLFSGTGLLVLVVLVASLVAITDEIRIGIFPLNLIGLIRNHRGFVGTAPCENSAKDQSRAAKQERKKASGFHHFVTAEFTKPEVHKAEIFNELNSAQTIDQ